MKNKDDLIIYVGKAKNLKKNNKNYYYEKELPGEVNEYIDIIDKYETDLTIKDIDKSKWLFPNPLRLIIVYKLSDFCSALKLHPSGITSGSLNLYSLPL